MQEEGAQKAYNDCTKKESVYFVFIKMHRVPGETALLGLFVFVSFLGNRYDDPPHHPVVVQ